MGRIIFNLVPLLIVSGVAIVIVYLTSTHPGSGPKNYASPSGNINPDVIQIITPPEASISAEIDSQEFIPPPLSRSFSYCVRLLDVPDSYRADLEAKLDSVYADPRGWSLGGALKFTEVQSSCNFTVILAAAADLPSFNSICSTVYSCTVGNQVILNFDRWSQGSAPWNGPLEDYRALVINHETGHWLGFGHLHCPGPGQLAPVMQQQSIDLEGCVINAWPLPSERQTLANRFGIKL